MHEQPLAPVREIRIYVLGVISILYGVTMGLLLAYLTLVYLSFGIQGNLYDVGTGMVILLGLVTSFSVPAGIGLIFREKWAVLLSYGIAAGILVLSGLGFVLNVTLDRPVVPLPFIPFFWAIGLNFTLRSSQLAKSIPSTAFRRRCWPFC
jgi:hypothetical protein